VFLFLQPVLDLLCHIQVVLYHGQLALRPGFYIDVFAFFRLFLQQIHHILMPVYLRLDIGLVKIGA